MSTDDEATRAFVDGFSTDMVTYLSKALQDGLNSRVARHGLCLEIRSAVSPLYDWASRCYNPQVIMPFQTSPDPDYGYEYHLLYRDNNHQLIHQVLDTPVDGTFNVSELTRGRYDDVVVIHITRNLTDGRCASFSTCRVYNPPKK